MTASAAPTTYLWIAYQSEPGMNGKRYELTAAKEAPKPIQPVVVNETEDSRGLTCDWSLYGDWKLLGTIKGRIVPDHLEWLVQMDTPKLRGAGPVDLPAILRNGWYKAA